MKTQQPSLLAGVRILDLSRVLAGPICTMMLGDHGANVIKVERPGSGDESRGWGPPFDLRGQSAYFLSVNRNKLSLAADLKSTSDCELLRQLALEADVVVENFNPGTLERRGLGARELLGANRRLIWCTISGFGPGVDRPGYDFVVQAEAGWMSVTGEPEGDPMKAGVAFVDVMAGKDAAVSVLAALAARGLGTLGDTPDARHLHTSLVHSATAALVNVAQNVLVSGRGASRWGNAHANLCPYQLFPTADGAVVIAVGSDAQWIACARALGLATLADDQSLRTNAGRLAQRGRVVGTIAAAVSAQTSAHWMAALGAAHVPCGTVKSVSDALRTVESSAASGVHPAAPGLVRFPPPTLDEHGAMVRSRLWAAFD